MYLEGTTTHNEGRVSTPACSVASPVSLAGPAHQLAVVALSLCILKAQEVTTKRCSCVILRPRGRPEEKDVRVLRFSLAIMPPSKVCPQCQASVPLKLKLCKCCQHVFQSKRKAEYSLSGQATKRMRATKRASETSEQTLHRQQQDRKCKTSTRANEMKSTKVQTLGELRMRGTTN